VPEMIHREGRADTPFTGSAEADRQMLSGAAIACGADRRTLTFVGQPPIPDYIIHQDRSHGRAAQANVAPPAIAPASPPLTQPTKVAKITSGAGHGSSDSLCDEPPARGLPCPLRH
jgi:hypothetical protein